MKKTVLLVLAMMITIGLTSFAYAGCTLGAKDCRDGYWWYCESCASQTCWIFKGIKCTTKSEVDINLASNEEPVIVAALQDCSKMKSCPDRCLCQYNNCCSGCDNLKGALEKSNCINRCISSWQDCNGRCR